jgi:hypothetical protein
MIEDFGNETVGELGMKMMFDYHNKVFTVVRNHDNRDVTNETVFFSKQYGAIVQIKYFGGNVKYGELIGLVDDLGILRASFNHANTSSQFYGGVCTFTPEKWPNNNPMRLQGKWQWADDQNSEGESIIEELP